MSRNVDYLFRGDLEDLADVVVARRRDALHMDVRIYSTVPIRDRDGIRRKQQATYMRAFWHSSRIWSTMIDRRIVVFVEHSYFAAERHRVRLRAGDTFV